MIELKRCRYGDHVSPVEEFGQMAASSDGLQAYCKVCKREYYLKQMKEKYNSPKAFAEYVMKKAEKRSREKSREFSITLDWVLNRLDEVDHTCERTGMVFVYDETPRHPHAMSIDRIDSNYGYTQTNCQLTTFMYNVGKNNWTDNDMAEMMESYAIRRMAP